MLPVVVGYARVSTLQQVAEGDGLDAQKDKLRGWCAYQGLELAHLEEDAGISGAATDNRPGFLRAVRAVLEAGEGAVLVVKKLDRLGRNALDIQETIAVLLDAKVRIVALDDGIDSASGMGAALLKLLVNILATFAELEKETIVGRLQEGRRRAKEQARVYSGELAYGLRVAEVGQKAMAEDPDELRAVARIRELRAEGKSLRAVAAALEAEGIRPRRAGKWSPVVVQRLATGKRGAMKKKTSARVERARAEFMKAS